MSASERLVHVRGLNFTYDEAPGPALKSIDLDIVARQRIILAGFNGAGKSTLLRVLSGMHLSRDWDAFDVLGNAHPADQFNGLAYLGGVWRRKLTNFSGMSAFTMDVRAGDMMKQWQLDHAARRDELVRVLGINLDWRMHRVSDGQRKKVRIMLKLLRPFRLCLVDEFAVELDILARKRLMDYLGAECEVRGAAVVYATHIFDQMDEWATHIAFMRPDRSLGPVRALSLVAEYQALRSGPRRAHCPMYAYVLNWMAKAEAQIARAAIEARVVAAGGGSAAGGIAGASIGIVGATEAAAGMSDTPVDDVAAGGGAKGGSVSKHALVVEREETPARAHNPYDSGYEGGRSKEMVKAHKYGPGVSDAEARRLDAAAAATAAVAKARSATGSPKAASGPIANALLAAHARKRPRGGPSPTHDNLVLGGATIMADGGPMDYV